MIEKILGFQVLLCLISIILIPFRSDSHIVIGEMYILLTKSILSFFITIILLFFMLPIFLIDSVNNIFRK
jgi:hypothetical protein